MFDDVLDLLDTVLAADTYDNFGKPILRGADLIKNTGAGAVAKGSGPLGWVFRGADYVVNDARAFDLPEGVRQQIALEAQQAKSGAFTGDLLPSQDGDQGASANSSAGDTGSRPPSADSVATGVFDP